MKGVSRVKTCIKGGNYFDVSKGCLLPNQGLVVEDGIITAFEDYVSEKESSVVLDIDGLCIFPGLINLHEHFTFRATLGPPLEILEAEQNIQMIRAIRNAQLSLARGITTVRDLGAQYSISHSLKKAINKGIISGPRMFIAGAPLSITGGHAWILSRETDGIIDLRRAVRTLIKEGVDWVKVMVSHDPVEGFGHEYTKCDYSLEELKVITEEAHQAGIMVSAHVMGTEAIRRCLEAGVDCLEHGIYLNELLAKRMVEQGTVLVPTISAYRRTTYPQFNRGTEWTRLHKALIQPHTESVKVAIEAGVKIGVATDSIGNYIEELEILHELGLSKTEVLRAATLGGARILGQGNNLGSIETQKLADLIMIKGNPLEDLKVLRNIEYVVKEGKFFKPEDFKSILSSNELPLDMFY